MKKKDKNKYISPSFTTTEEVDLEVSLEDFSDDELLDEVDFRGLLKHSENESKVDDWKDELWQEHKHKFTLEEIETFLTSK